MRKEFEHNKEIVEKAIGNCVRFRAFKEECRIYREMLLILLDIFEVMEEDLEMEVLPSLVVAFNQTIQTSLKLGVGVLEKCSQKMLLDPLLFSELYMDLLLQSKNNILAAVMLLLASRNFKSKCVMESICELDKIATQLDCQLDESEHGITNAVKREFHADGPDKLRRVVRVLETERVVNDAEDFEEQMDMILREKQSELEERLMQPDSTGSMQLMQTEIFEFLTYVNAVHRKKSQDFKITPKTAKQASILSSDIPEILLCSIMHLPMEDPVFLVENGLFYDRKYMCRWLLQNPDLDPHRKKYNEPLSFHSAISIRGMLMEHFGNGCYVPYDDNKFWQEYQSAWWRLRRTKSYTRMREGHAMDRGPVSTELETREMREYLFSASPTRGGQARVATNSVTIVVLLADPNSRKFELLQLTFPNPSHIKIWAVLDAMKKIAIQPVIKTLQFDALVDRNGSCYVPRVFLSNASSNQRGNKDILVARKQGMSTNQCDKIARPILNDSKVIEMLRSLCYDVSGWQK